MSTLASANASGHSSSEWRRATQSGRDVKHRDEGSGWIETEKKRERDSDRMVRERGGARGDSGRARQETQTDALEAGKKERERFEIEVD